MGTVHENIASDARSWIFQKRKENKKCPYLDDLETRIAAAVQLGHASMQTNQDLSQACRHFLDVAEKSPTNVIALNMKMAEISVIYQASHLEMPFPETLLAPLQEPNDERLKQLKSSGVSSGTMATAARTRPPEPQEPRPERVEPVELAA